MDVKEHQCVGERHLALGAGHLCQGAVENEDPFKNQTWSLSSLVWKGKANANISHLGSNLTLRLADMSNGLSSRLERKSLHRRPAQGDGEVSAVTSKRRRRNWVKACERRKSEMDV